MLFTGEISTQMRIFEQMICCLKLGTSDQVGIKTVGSIYSRSTHLNCDYFKISHLYINMTIRDITYSYMYVPNYFSTICYVTCLHTNMYIFHKL